VVEEAINELDRDDIAFVHFHQLYPLHPDTKSLLDRAEKVISLENNAAGQFPNVLKLYANFEIPKQNQFLKYIGEPYMVEEVKAWIEKEVN
jgi:2-oxoglutarate ferredoxin oxidoreductase subunit alpha